MSDKPIDGEIYEPDAEPQGLDEPEDPFMRFLLPTRPFGELLLSIRQRISESFERPLTQEQFGELLGGTDHAIDQVTISRWQRGTQKPQRRQLEMIVKLAHEYGMRGITVERLEQSLKRDVEQYAGIDPRVIRLNTLLAAEDETFKEEFFEVVIGLYHILRGVRRSRNP